MCSVGVVVKDAAGALQGGWTLLLRGEGGSEAHLDQTDPARAEIPLVIGQRYRWTLVGHGLRRSSGEVVAAATGTELAIEATAGFSVHVHAMDISNFHPAKGAALFADGEAVGVFDADGNLVVDRPLRPRTLTVDGVRWRVFHDGAHRSDLAATGAFAPRRPTARLFVYLQRLL